MTYRMSGSSTNGWSVSVRCTARSSGNVDSRRPVEYSSRQSAATRGANVRGVDTLRRNLFTRPNPWSTVA
jgi:hypothetical protein